MLILYSHLRLRFPSGLFPAGFPTNILYAFRIAPMLATCPPFHPLIHSLQYLAKSSNYEISSYVIFFFRLSHPLLGRSALFSTLFSNTQNVRYSLRVGDRVHTRMRQQVKLCCNVYVFK